MTHYDCAYYRLEWDHCWQRVAWFNDGLELWRCAVCHTRMLMRFDEGVTDTADDEQTAAYYIEQGPEMPRDGLDIKPTFEFWAFEQELDSEGD